MLATVHVCGGVGWDLLMKYQARTNAIAACFIDAEEVIQALGLALDCALILLVDVASGGT